MDFRVTISELQTSLQKMWSRETSVAPQSWRAANPAADHCAQTALLVQDQLGGEIVRVNFQQPDGERGQHYFNLLPKHGRCDLTAGQFPAGTIFTPAPEAGIEALREYSREYLLSRGYGAQMDFGDGSAVMRDDLLSDPPTRKAYQRLKEKYAQQAVDESREDGGWSNALPRNERGKRQHHRQGEREESKWR